MADYYPVLKRAISSLPSTSGDARRIVYEKARAALLKQLQSYNPPLSPAEITEQRLALEECIRRVEAEVAGAAFGLTPAPAGPEAPPAPPAPPPGQTAADRLRAAAEPPPAPEARVEPPAPRPPLPPLPPRPEPRTAPARAEPAAPPPLPSPAAAAPRRDPTPPPAVEPRVGAGMSALSNTLRQADSLGGASARAVRSARDAIEDTPPPAEPAAGEEKIEPSFLDAPLGRGADPAAPPIPTADAPERGRGPARGEARRPRVAAPTRPRTPVDAPRRRSFVGPAVIAVILLAVVGAGAVGWTQRDRISALWTPAPTAPAQPEVAVETPASVDDGLDAKIEDRLPAEGEASPVAPDARSVETVNVGPPPDGVFPPADGSAQTAPPAAAPEAPPVAAEVPPATPEPSAPAATPPEQEVAVAPANPPPAADTAPVLPIAQRAILYEEPIPGSDGARVEGRVTWSLVEEPVLPGEPPVPQVRAVVDVPERGMTLTLSIRRNTDDALPASHVVEAKFDLPADFDGRGIDTTPGLILKETEGARGDPLVGAVAKVADNLFWIALSGAEQETAKNLSLLEERQWIDVPIRYGNRRRAILTFEKGDPGTRAFTQAMTAWRG